MEKIIKPAERLNGTLKLPGDETLGCLACLLGTLIEGETRIGNHPTGSKFREVVDVLVSLGSPLSVEKGTLVIRGGELSALARVSHPVPLIGPGEFRAVFALPFAPQVRCLSHSGVHVLR